MPATYMIPTLMGEPGELKAWYLLSTSSGPVLLIFQAGSHQYQRFTSAVESMLEGTGERLGGLGLGFGAFEEAAEGVLELDPTLRGTSIINGDGPDGKHFVDAVQQSAGSIGINEA